MWEPSHGTLNTRGVKAGGSVVWWPIGWHGTPPLAASGRLPRDRSALAWAAAEARTALEDAAVAAAEAAARARTVATVLDEALTVLAAAERAVDSARPRASESRGPIDGLSPREREVLAMVAEGRSNKAIAQALYVSPNTIKTHVASLLSKLHVESRVQLAAMATRHGLL
jgi:DNA-binding NarL/FixJ family response regulator